VIRPPPLLGAALATILLASASAGPALGQDVYRRQQHLLDEHALLIDLPPVEAPGALSPGQLDLGLEVVGIPAISGSTGNPNEREITISDRARVFPRPRLSLGLPAPPGFRAMVGLGYVPPIEIEHVTLDLAAAEAEVAFTPGALRLGLRGHLVYGEARAPVTSPSLRDRLSVGELGWEASAGYELRAGRFSLTPYAGAGQVLLDGHFRSSVDGGTVKSRYAGAALHTGARLLYHDHWEAAAEWSLYPGRLSHPRLRVGYVLGLW